jgi:hypothetical protein
MLIPSHAFAQIVIGGNGGTGGAGQVGGVGQNGGTCTTPNCNANGQSANGLPGTSANGQSCHYSRVLHQVVCTPG